MAGRNPTKIKVSGDESLIPNQLATEETLQDILDKTGNVNACGNKLVSTYYDKFRDDFATYDTTNNWTTVQQGTNHTIQVRGDANGARYLEIATGSTNNQETILLSKINFTMPFQVVWGMSTSTQAAEFQHYFEVVEVDSNGNVVEDTSIVAAPNCSNARNCASIMYPASTTATQQRYNLRSSGLAELTSAASTFGTITATGSSEDLIQASNFYITALNDYVVYGSQPIDVLTAGAQFKRSQRSLDCTKTYAIRIRVKNTNTTARTYRIHFIRVMDATRVSVDFGLIAGRGDIQSSVPVIVTSAPTTVVVEAPSTSYGTALSHQLISAATINATLVKTGASLLDSLNLFNRADYTCFMKLYNKATTAPVPSTNSASLVAMIPIPPGEYINVDTGRYADRFTLGLGYAITKGATVIDETAVAAGDILLNLTYA